MVGTGLFRWLLGDAMGPRRLLLCPDSVSLITAGDRPSISQGLGFGTPVSTATGFNTRSGSTLGPFPILLGLAACFEGWWNGSLCGRWLLLGLALGAALGFWLSATG
jgi:hypothetical protein